MIQKTEEQRGQRENEISCCSSDHCSKRSEARISPLDYKQMRVPMGMRQVPPARRAMSKICSPVRFPTVASSPTHQIAKRSISFDDRTATCGRWNPKDTQRQSRVKTGTAHAFDPKCRLSDQHQVKCYRSFRSLRTPKERGAVTAPLSTSSQVLSGARPEHQAIRPN